MALRTGAEYLKSLQDGREVYLDGARIADVTSAPGLSAVAHTTARMYDLVIEHQDRMTFCGPEGGRFSLNWIEPKNRGELFLRRTFTEAIARRTGGLFGRQQDYVPLFHLGMIDIKREFSRGNERYERNIENYWQFARERDLMLAHAFIDAQAHPAAPIEETAVPRIVARKSDGIVVRGAKTVGTFAAHADEVLIGGYPRAGITSDHALYFSIPIATPGVRIVARTVYGDGGAFDHPVSRYGDENDCIIIFDDVLIPWERVFCIGDLEFCAKVFPRITEWAHWSILARLAVKAEILTGLYTMIPEMMGREQQAQAQEAAGEIIRYLTTLRAFIHAAEDQGHVTPSGHYMPNPSYVTAGRAYSVENYRRIAGYLYDIASQALVNMPTERAFDEPTTGPVLEDIFKSPAASARERARITRLAWDMIGDSFGGRQTLFELFNALPWTAQRAQLVASFDAEPYKALARATAGIGSLEEAARRAADAAAPKMRDYTAVGQTYADQSAGKIVAR
ncbi:MAG: 4-hydroxyphenylacetate 3-hydroxylase N-terminal domain-containing protein [Candidatus Binataceae bacterium]